MLTPFSAVRLLAAVSSLLVAACVWAGAPDGVREEPALVLNLREAYDAFAKNRPETLQRSLASLRGTSVAAYAEYWSLLLQMRAHNKASLAASPDKDAPDDLPAELTGRLARFVMVHGEDCLGEQALADWARSAALARNTPLFRMLYGFLSPAGQRAPDMLARRLTFELADGVADEGTLKEAQRLLIATRTPQSDVFGRLAKAVLQADPAWLWPYTLVLLQKNHFSLARDNLTAEAKLPVRRNDLLDLLTAPRQWLEQNRTSLATLDPELLAAAALRLTAVEASLADEVVAAAQDRWSDSLRYLVLSRLGYRASVDLKPQALAYYRAAGTPPSDTDTLHPITDVQQRLVWHVRAALRNGTADEQLLALSRLPAPLGVQPEWIYWKARALNAVNRQDEARALFASLARRQDFYGLLACDALGRTYFTPKAAKREPLTDEDAARLSALPAVRRALDLYAANLYFQGHREWAWAQRHLSPGERVKLMQLAAQTDNAHRQIAMALQRQDASLTEIFPRPFAKEVTAAAKAAGLPEAWIYGVIHQESRFMHAVASSAGALGLMQIMPKTGQWVADKTGVRDFTPERLRDVEFNLRIGSRYLKMVADSVRGSIVMTAASYNAGPAKAQLWRSTLTSEVEGAVFVETIPYGETREYVKRVSTNIVQ
ncbi:MAG: transglycosylase SLT domain-containing protein, partial [Duodenibacillus sp.]